MILDILEKYSDIIVSYEIHKFRILGIAYELVMEIQFVQNTRLHVRDYLFMDSSRKYAFHWQDHESRCIIRWDNAPHHQKTVTFPFHKHIGEDENVDESEVMNLEKVLSFIQERLNLSL